MPDRTLTLKIAVITIIVILLALWFYKANFATYHFLPVKEGLLYRDGLRNVDEFARACRKGNIKMIVSLLDNSEVGNPTYDQMVKFTYRAKLKQTRIPILLGGWPTTEDVQAFLTIVETPKRQPVLVHCAQGVRRTGMMVAAYQMSVLGYDKAQAKAAIQSFGHSSRTTGDIERFIDIYDPVKREVTQTLPRSTE